MTDDAKLNPFDASAEGFPDKYPLILAQMVQGQTLAEISLADLISAEFGMGEIETYAMIGRLDPINRLSKLQSLYQARKDKNGIKLTKSYAKWLRPSLDARNTVIHGICLRHDYQDDGLHLYDSANSYYVTEAESDVLQAKIIDMPAALLIEAAQVFFKVANVIGDLAKRRKAALAPQTKLAPEPTTYSVGG